jgi:hypothetical protein
METARASRGRIQIVLVPGFAGFDALGQLHYYADVTPVFREWAAEWAGRGGAHPVLHYFDNLPTAGVATRSARLRDWIAKRIARGELQEGDRLALVGHSTGGLDVRQLVWNLARRPGEEIPIDGSRGAAYTVRAREVLEQIQRMVFLSVPQWGTNLADWVRDHAAARMALIADLRGAIAARDVPLAGQLERWAAGNAAAFTRSELFLAVKDALAEMDVRPGADPTAVAAALEARSEVELWLRYVWADFAAIDDLAVAPGQDRATPARFDADTRRRELDAWAGHGILSRSYATVGSRAFQFERGVPAPAWKLLNPFTWAEPDGGAAGAPRTDLVYRMSYRACAGGPFGIPGGGATAAATRFDTGQLQELEVWDNDGIVNTASMLWPEGSATRLVAGDHGDIIGHYRLVEAAGAGPRVHHTYDLLGSGSGFGEETFRAVWRDVFEFCAS